MNNIHCKEFAKYQYCKEFATQQNTFSDAYSKACDIFTSIQIPSTSLKLYTSEVSMKTF